MRGLAHRLFGEWWRRGIIPYLLVVDRFAIPIELVSVTATKASPFGRVPRMGFVVNGVVRPSGDRIIYPIISKPNGRVVILSQTRVLLTVRVVEDAEYVVKYVNPSTEEAVVYASIGETVEKRVVYVKYVSDMPIICDIPYHALRTNPANPLKNNNHITWGAKLCLSGKRLRELTQLLSPY